MRASTEFAIIVSRGYVDSRDPDFRRSLNLDKEDTCDYRGLWLYRIKFSGKTIWSFLLNSLMAESFHDALGRNASQNVTIGKILDGLRS